MPQHRFSWICALNFLRIELFHISEMVFFSERAEQDVFFVVGISSLNERHVSHPEVHTDRCTEDSITQVFVKSSFDL